MLVVINKLELVLSEEMCEDLQQHIGYFYYPVTKTERSQI